jgi:hypothetical protein
VAAHLADVHLVTRKGDLVNSGLLSRGLRDHVAVCVCLCNPPIVARQRLGKSALIVASQRLGKNSPIVARQRLGRNVTAVTNTHASI